MAPKRNRKRRKEITDEVASTEKVESLENKSQASEDIPHQLRSKKHQGSTGKEKGVRTGDLVPEAIQPNNRTTEVAALGAVLSPNHIAGVDADSKPAPESELADSTPAAESELAEITDSSIKQANVISTKHIDPTPREEFTDIDVYHPPFTIYQRFIPDSKWNEDSLVSTPDNIFPDTGQRRKKEVKDNFDWLQPAI